MLVFTSTVISFLLRSTGDFTICGELLLTVLKQISQLEHRQRSCVCISHQEMRIETGCYSQRYDGHRAWDAFIKFSTSWQL
jgi:hypothetical protein